MRAMPTWRANPPRAGLALLVVLLRPSLAGAEEAPPWETRFLDAPPAEVRAAARRVPDAAAQPVVILFEERVSSFDERGRARTRHRQAYKVTSPAGVSGGWAEVRTSWRSWNESRPTMRARVVDAGGRAHELDPATIEESGARSKDPTLYSDVRVLRAPLPAVAVGAVVELEVEQESGPLIVGGGHSESWTWGGTVPVRKSRLVIEHPTGLSLQLVQRPRETVLPVSSQSDGRRRLVFEGGPYEAAPPPEPYRPADDVWRPYVSYGTAPSWSELARRYHAIVEQRLAGADVRARAREAAGGERELVAVVRRVLARLHRDVRYTGVELGASAIEPAAPGEVLARGYGDCKDKSTLLVALLRALGIKAHVALLRAGVGLDVDPGVAGIGELNHAIVYLPGKRPLYVDPTAPHAPVGELPISDQGRRILVVAPDTKELLVTPRDGAAGSRAREIRTVYLAETGAPRVVERFEPQGAAAREIRGHYAETERKRLDEQLERYVKVHYDAQQLTKLTFGDPDDLTRPFWLEVEAAGVGLGSTEEGVAGLGLRAGPVLDRLPAELRPTENDGKSGAGKRKTDFEIYEPYTYELRYRVVPPHGFTPGPLPLARTDAWGPIKLESRYSAGKDGVVEAVFELVAERRRLAPAEYESVRTGIGKFLNGEAARVSFRAAGQVALEAGDVKEAIRLFRRLDEEHAGQAMHAIQLARALLQAGLGEAARRQARAATERDPRSSEAFRVLGEVLARDLVGRARGATRDLAGAEAAYRAALAVDGEDWRAKVALAEMLGGEPDAPPPPRARLAEASRLWGEVVAAGREGLRGHWLLALLREGRWREVIERGTNFQLPDYGHAAVLAALAITRGAAAATREGLARVPAPEERRKVLQMAATEVMNRRRYADASALFGEAARGSDSDVAMRTLADSLRRARPFEERPIDRKDPVAVARRVLQIILMGGAHGEMAARLAPYATKEVIAALEGDGFHRGFTRGLAQKGMAAGDLLPVVVADLMSEVPGRADGDARVGYLVVLGPAEAPAVMKLLLAARPEGPRVLALYPSAAAALEARRLGRAGDLEGARHWLGWLTLMRGGFPAPPGLEGSARVKMHPVLYGGNIESLPELEHQVALELTLDTGKAGDDPETDALLERCAAGAVVEERRHRCASTLIRRAWSRRRPADGLALLEKLGAKAFGPGYEAFRRDLLIDVGRYAEVRASLLKPETARTPDDQRTAASRLLRGGDLAAAEAIYRRLVAGDAPDDSDFNQLAWLRLLAGDAGDATLDWARRAVELSRRKNPASLHTLATALAEREAVAEARDVIRESMEARPDGEPSAADHYVLGRLAEACGVRDAALDSYGRVGGRNGDASSTAVLAARRMKALGAPAAPARP
jgi:tetratricopeptide (TPR) repeat protein